MSSNPCFALAGTAACLLAMGAPLGFAKSTTPATPLPIVTQEDYQRSLGQDLLKRGIDIQCQRLYDSADPLALAAEFGSIFAQHRVESFIGRWPMFRQSAAPAGEGNIRAWLRDLAKTKIWVAPAVEQQLAQVAHQRYAREGLVIPPSALPSDRARRFAEVRALLQRIVATLPSDNPYKFELAAIRGIEVNAKVGLGGHVYVTEGLLDDEDLSPQLLALILAHEVSHVTRRHVLKEFQVKLIDWADVGKSLEAQFTALAANPLAQISRMIEVADLQRLRMVGYDHDQELEADNCGMFVMSRIPGTKAFEAMHAFVAARAAAPSGIPSTQAPPNGGG